MFEKTRNYVAKTSYELEQLREALRRYTRVKCINTIAVNKPVTVAGSEGDLLFFDREILRLHKYGQDNN